MKENFHPSWPGLRHSPSIASKAQQEVGDGCEPNHYYVSVSGDIEDGDVNNPVYIGRMRQIIGRTGPGWNMVNVFDNWDEAKDFADSIELTEDIDCGPSAILIEDRRVGTCWERYLEARTTVVYTEQEFGGPNG